MSPRSIGGLCAHCSWACSAPGHASARSSELPTPVVKALSVFSAGTRALRVHADAVQTRAVAGSSMAWLVASEPFHEREPEAARTRDADATLLVGRFTLVLS